METLNADCQHLRAKELDAQVKLENYDQLFNELTVIKEKYKERLREHDVLVSEKNAFVRLLEAASEEKKSFKDKLQAISKEKNIEKEEEIKRLTDESLKHKYELLELRTKLESSETYHKEVMCLNYDNNKKLAIYITD